MNKIELQLILKNQQKMEIDSKIERFKMELSFYLQDLNISGFIGSVFRLFELKEESEEYLNALNIISSGLHPIIMKDSNSLKKLFEVRRITNFLI